VRNTNKNNDFIQLFLSFSVGLEISRSVTAQRYVRTQAHYWLTLVMSVMLAN